MELLRNYRNTAGVLGRYYGVILSHWKTRVLNLNNFLVGHLTHYGHSVIDPYYVY